MLRKSGWLAMFVAVAVLPAGGRAAEPELLAAAAAGTAGAAQYRDVASMTRLAADEKWRLLRAQLRYVFIIFQENRSFDHYFASYPGADGLFADGQRRQVPGGVQRIRTRDGRFTDIAPFLIPRSVIDVNGHAVPLYPEDTHTTDHTHAGILHGLHLAAATQGGARNDGYALAQEHLFYHGDSSDDADIVGPGGVLPATPPTLAQQQAGELALAHLDCDTIPFLWQYADRFTLFDNFHQTTIGPSAPNAIAMIAGQTGETQWALHPEQGDAVHFTLPNASDRPPYGGSAADHTADPPPYGTHEQRTHGQRNLTFATLPLSFLGGDIGRVTAADPDPTADLPDVPHDITTIAAHNAAVPWAWYQQGFGAEPYDGSTTPDGIAHPPHASYVVHHNALQYFGYLADNPLVRAQVHGLSAFFAAVAARALPASGGVFYIRGGYYNNDGLQTLDPNPAIRARFAGNDDHPAYADAQISEAHVADTVNAIAASPYWAHSVIIITYDETDGLYDHVLPRLRARGPDGMALTGGPRVPAILISPFAAAHTIAHDYSEHSSVIRFINTLFGLIPLADLPDEQRERALGRAQDTTGHQEQLGPADTDAAIGDLSAAFDDDRLRGTAPVLPAEYAMIPRAAITALPHAGGAGCRALGITPTDYVNGAPIDPPPADFNPRPVQSPGIPTAGDWTP